jgi:hypothetical protein
MLRRHKVGILLPLLLVVVGIVGILSIPAEPTKEPRPLSAPISSHLGVPGKVASHRFPVVGETVHSSTGTWSNCTLSDPCTFTYQWQACTPIPSTSRCSEAAGAPNNTSAYTVDSRDSGYHLRVVVRAKNRAGSASQPSALTGVVTGRPGPLATELARAIGTRYGTFGSQSKRVAYVPGPNGGIFVSYISFYQLNSKGGQSSCYIGSTTPPSATTCIASTTARFCSPQCTDGTTHASKPWTIVNVARSTDGGSTWTLLLRLGLSGNAPPTLEADSAGNVYAFVNDYGATDGAWLYEFHAGNYSRPSIIATLPYGNTDKFTSAYDATNNLLWYIKGNWTAGCPDIGTGCVRIWKMRASTVSGTQVTPCGATSWTANCYANAISRDCGPLVLYQGTVDGGGSAVCGSDNNTIGRGTTYVSGGSYPEYPFIFKDRSGSGLTLMAWTNTVYSSPSAYYYYDIHYIVSPDSGTTWYGTNGKITSWPIVGGDDGPSWQLLRSSDYAHTCCSRGPTRDNNWLDSIYVQDGHLYFAYTHQNGVTLGGITQTYRRLTATYISGTDSYEMTTDVARPIRGSNLHNSHGFFSGFGTAGAPIFFTAATGSKIVTLESRDDGMTWRAYASSRTTFTDPYSVSGTPSLDTSGNVLGAFTDQRSPAASSNVWFFRSAP